MSENIKTDQVKFLCRYNKSINNVAYEFHFKKGEYYEFIKEQIKNDQGLIETNYLYYSPFRGNHIIVFVGETVHLQDYDFKLYDFFYTKPEERKIKLEKFIDG